MPDWGQCDCALSRRKNGQAARQADEIAVSLKQTPEEGVVCVDLYSPPNLRIAFRQLGKGLDDTSNRRPRKAEKQDLLAGIKFRDKALRLHNRNCGFAGPGATSNEQVTRLGKDGSPFVRQFQQDQPPRPPPSPARDLEQAPPLASRVVDRGHASRGRIVESTEGSRLRCTVR